MYIDKFVAVVKDVYTKKNKRVKIDADDVFSAHKKALEHCNELTQDVVKITNGENEIVYTLSDGFVV